jgi:hypothetical protein
LQIIFEMSDTDDDTDDEILADFDDGIYDDISSQITAAIAASVATTIKVLVATQQTKKRSAKQRSGAIRIRNRKSVLHIYKELGDTYFRRAYRMQYSTFCTLADMLGPFIDMVSGKFPNTKNFRHNGPILTSVRLASALRWFSGGSIYDIMTTFGISHTEAMDSCWYVVDAINKIDALQFSYPNNHDDQRAIAAAFKDVSAAEFECCAGAIDGILVWIHKPTQKDCNIPVCLVNFFVEGKRNLV